MADIDAFIVSAELTCEIFANRRRTLTTQADRDDFVRDCHIRGTEYQTFGTSNNNAMTVDEQNRLAKVLGILTNFVTEFSQRNNMLARLGQTVRHDDVHNAHDGATHEPSAEDMEIEAMYKARITALVDNIGDDLKKREMAHTILSFKSPSASRTWDKIDRILNMFTPDNIAHMSRMTPKMQKMIFHEECKDNSQVRWQQRLADLVDGNGTTLPILSGYCAQEIGVCKLTCKNPLDLTSIATKDIDVLRFKGIIQHCGGITSNHEAFINTTNMYKHDPTTCYSCSNSEMTHLLRLKKCGCIICCIREYQHLEPEAVQERDMIKSAVADESPGVAKVMKAMTKLVGSTDVQKRKVKKYKDMVRNAAVDEMAMEE